jgi:hypothetical protein
MYEMETRMEWGKLRYFKMMAVEDVVLDWVGGDVSCL